MGVQSRFFDPSRVRASRAANSGDLWHRLMPWMYIVILMLFLALGAAVFWPVLKRGQALQDEKVALQRKIENAKIRGRQMDEELLALKNDRLYIERMARDLLNYGREGETIFKFPPYEDSSLPRRSATKPQ